VLRHVVGGLLLFVALVAASACAPSPESTTDPVAPSLDYAIAIHAGAGVIAEDRQSFRAEPYVESLERALGVGRSILDEGGSSLDAVERVIVLLEDDPLFNAGRGAVFNHEGRNELDASIMDGRNLSCGAVAGVSNVKNPIVLARLVMTETRHVLLGGAGAEQLGLELGLEPVTQDYYYTQPRWDALQRAITGEAASSGGGTVGVAALDREGNLAAGTSTGGLTDKRFGRIGDSPIIGAGTYADNRTCAVSATGKGEEFIRHNVAARISGLIEHGGMTLQEAAEQVVNGRLVPGDGGVIGVSRDGAIAMVFNTRGMYRGAANSAGRFEVAIW